MNKVVSLFYYLNIFPAFSIFQSLIKLYVSSRFISIIFIPFVLYKKKFWIVDKALFPFIFLLIYFIFYTIIAFVDNRSVIVYTGYVIAFSYIIMFYYVIKYYTNFFLNFMKFFLILNAFYVLLQIVFLNVGLSSFAMVHSNLPAQNHYEIPVFVSEPFFRYTGLFNESSPFAFYLIICFVFFQQIGLKYKRYKNIAIVLLFFSGAKIAYIFLVLHYAFFFKNFFVRLIFKALFVGFFISFFYFLQDLGELLAGQTASLNERFKSLISFDNITLIGTDLGKSSEGDMGLNFFSIFISGFGLVGFLLAICMFMLFYLLLKTKSKKYFIFPLLLGLLASGSLLIFQYALLFATLFYLNEVDKKRLYNE